MSYQRKTKDVLAILLNGEVIDTFETVKEARAAVKEYNASNTGYYTYRRKREKLEPTYTVFLTTWYKDNPEWPNGLEPSRKTLRVLKRNIATEDEAREHAQAYNKTHEPGRYSKKAEFEQI